MQAHVGKVVNRFALRQIGKDVPPDPDDPDPDAALVNFGLNYPFGYLWHPFVRWYRSEFVALPAAGGWDDQDPLLMDDFFLLLGLVDFYQRQGKRGNMPEPDRDFWK